MAAFEHYALVIPSGFSLLTFRHTNATTPDEILVTLGVGHTNPLMLQSELDTCRDAWETHLMDNMAPETTFVRVDCSDAGGVRLEALSGTVGTTVGAMAPLNCAAIVKKVTGVSGRRNRGRMYLPTVAESVVDQGGNLTGGFMTAMNDSLDDFTTDIAVDSVFPFILHSKGWNGGSEPADPGNAPAPTAITGWSTGSRIGTQRRRLR